MREITKSELNRWKANSLELAAGMGFDSDVLQKVDSKTWVEVVDTLPNLPTDPQLVFGICQYGPNNCLIDVRKHNASTRFDGDWSYLFPTFKEMGLSYTDIAKIDRALSFVSPEAFYDIFNQSGMDHELIGHAYDYFAHPEKYGFFSVPSEESATSAQLRLAAQRAKKDKSWEHMLSIMPRVLRGLKGFPSQA